ncbi:DinB family protein [Peribacillus sp. NPDC006672]|uniref:DinB family protein n=1 Tax=Peribacillus sp. NPDC006672 TaxID=3390606 RepID=UPI003D01B873
MIFKLPSLRHKRRPRIRVLKKWRSCFVICQKSIKNFLTMKVIWIKRFPSQHPQVGLLDTHLSELVQHVINHGTYYRGNLTAMIRQQGYSSVPTDYVFYLYEISSTK